MEVHKSPDSFHEKELSPAEETHSRHSLRSLKSVATSFATSFDRLTSFGGIHFEQEVRNKGLGFIKSLVDGNPLLIHLWNEILVMLCVIATSLDPLFCYILLVDEDKRCVGFDKKLRTVAVVLRSITDFLYIILIVCHFHLGYSPFYSANCGNPNDGVWKRAWRFFLSYFTVDILAVLPLPQVAVFALIPSFKGYRFIYAVRSLKYILVVQYLPRVFRIYSFLKKVRWSSNILPETAGAKAAFNLFLYMLASHVIGAFWYLFTIERKTTCWEESCPHCPLNCNYFVGNSSVAMASSCSAEAEKGSKPFNFGIFKDGLHIVVSRNFIRKISFCYWWGLQKLSSLGQDLKTSDHVWEIYFAVTISISGLVLFALLVGNMQTYLQSTIARLEEMRSKGQDIELWIAYHSLPKRLKKKIKKYERYKWRETKGVDVEQLLHNLPRDLRRDTKKHLCSAPLSNVPKFQNIDDKLLDAICDYLKPVLYIEHNFIVQEEEPLDEMIFIIRGKVMIYSKRDGENNAAGSSGSNWLTKGDFYGEDLLEWVLRNPTSTTVPISTKTIRAHSKVEAFVLSASDLKMVVSKFWWLFSKNSPSLKAIWAPWAALALQLAWRRYRKSEKEKKKPQFVIERRINTQNFDSPFLVTAYIVRFLRALKLKRKKTHAESSSV